jgi:hypothetical protein
VEPEGTPRNAPGELFRDSPESLDCKPADQLCQTQDQDVPNLNPQSQRRLPLSLQKETWTDSARSIDEDEHRSRPCADCTASHKQPAMQNPGGTPRLQLFFNGRL